MGLQKAQARLLLLVHRQASKGRATAACGAVAENPGNSRRHKRGARAAAGR